MAKKRRGTAKSTARRTRRQDNQLEKFAEDLGHMLGTAQARASAWINQRKTVAKQLAEIRDSASSMLQQLSKENPFSWGRPRPKRAAATRRRKTARARKR